MCVRVYVRCVCVCKVYVCVFVCVCVAYKDQKKKYPGLGYGDGTPCVCVCARATHTRFVIVSPRSLLFLQGPKKKHPGLAIDGDGTKDRLFGVDPRTSVVTIYAAIVAKRCVIRCVFVV